MNSPFRSTSHTDLCHNEWKHSKHWILGQTLTTVGAEVRIRLIRNVKNKYRRIHSKDGPSRFRFALRFVSIFLYLRFIRDVHPKSHRVRRTVTHLNSWSYSIAGIVPSRLQ